MTNPWDQQPKESSKAFLAFTAYRDMGLERSCQKVAESLRIFLPFTSYPNAIIGRKRIELANVYVE